MALNEHELVQHAREGDARAFEQLVRMYDKHVYSIAARYGNSAHDAKDIYQEVFIRAYKGLRRFRMQSEFSTWLYRITTNFCLTHQSQRKKRSGAMLSMDDDEQDVHTVNSIQPAGGGPSPEDRTFASEISLRVKNALQVLSPQQKLVFTLRHYEGYKLREIATMMSCTEGTVKRYLFAATQRMRGELKELLD